METVNSLFNINDKNDNRGLFLMEGNTRPYKLYELSPSITVVKTQPLPFPKSYRYKTESQSVSPQTNPLPNRPNSFNPCRRPFST